MTRVTACALALLAPLLAACDATAAGRAAYAEGRFDDALAAFTAATERAGDGASAELHYDRALAALRAGDVAVAESAADAAAERGGPRFAALRDFVHGNASFARAELAAAQAASVEAEPFAFDVAVRHAESAERAWRRAAAARAPWPEAERNVLRAQALLEELRRRKAEADARRGRKTPGAPPRPRDLKPTDRPPDAPEDGEPPPPPLPPPPPRPAPETTTDAPPAGGAVPLAPGEIARVADALARKEREKRRVRAAEQRARTPGTEKDW